MADDDERHNETIESSGAGASKTYPMQCSALRKGGHVLIKGRPCKIQDMSTSKTGKHGHAKVHLIATDIFTNKKLEDISPSTHNMDVPIIERKEYLLLDITDEGFLSLLGETSLPKEDVRVPEDDMGANIRQMFADGKSVFVTIISAMGEEAVQSVKEGPKND